MTQLTFLEEEPGKQVQWQGSRDAAMHRLKVFLPRAGRAYAGSRNFDFGQADRSNISCLSPWIRHRLLLEEEVVRETLSVHSLSASEKFVQEVFWRAYFKGWMEHRPGVWLQYRKDVARLLEEIENHSDLRNRYESAVCGRTGIDCLDAWAKELVETGYLHNHARMWFASIWVFTLRLPWQLGADFFYRHLLDGDPASNTLSWRWVCGLHTKGKHYVARASNIEKFTQGRFSPVGLAADPIPLVEEFEHPIQPIAIRQIAATGQGFGLVITEEDCCPETLALPGRPAAICGLVATQSRSPAGVGKPAMEFTANAMNDALERAGVFFQLETTCGDPDNWGDFLVQWARKVGVSQLVTALAPAGPVQEKLELARPALEQANISLVEVKRDYDTASWPHASRGFFRLKKQIPQLVKSLDLI